MGVVYTGASAMGRKTTSILSGHRRDAPPSKLSTSRPVIGADLFPGEQVEIAESRSRFRSGQRLAQLNTDCVSRRLTPGSPHWFGGCRRYSRLDDRSKRQCLMPIQPRRVSRCYSSHQACQPNSVHCFNLSIATHPPLSCNLFATSWSSSLSKSRLSSMHLTSLTPRVGVVLPGKRLELPFGERGLRSLRKQRVLRGATTLFIPPSYFPMCSLPPVLL